MRRCYRDEPMMGRNSRWALAWVSRNDDFANKYVPPAQARQAINNALTMEASVWVQPSLSQLNLAQNHLSAR